MLLMLFFHKMVDRLTEQTYPKLPSTRYSLMYEYFTYLQWCVEHGAVVNVRTIIINSNLTIACTQYIVTDSL